MEGGACALHVKGKNCMIFRGGGVNIVVQELRYDEIYVVLHGAVYVTCCGGVVGNERRRKDLGEGTAAVVVTIKSLLFMVLFDCRMIYGRFVAVMPTMLCFNNRSRRLFKHCYGIM